MRLIDADELIVDMRIGFSTFPSAPQFGTMCSQYGVTIRQIENAPTIDVVPKDFHDKTCEAMAKRHTEEIQRLMPKQGEWKPFDLTWGRSIWYCTACEESTEVPCDIWEHKPIYKYCPNCGADMCKESE